MNKMKSLSICLIVIAFAVFCRTAVAQNVFKMKIVAHDGSWQLRESKDGFSGKLTCLITNADNRFIQVSHGSFYIVYAGRGGVQGYQYRIDNGPVSGMQLPTEIEKQVGVVALSGATLDSILAARRLRVQTLTYVAGLKNEDINLAGLNPLYGEMSNICPND